MSFTNKMLHIFLSVLASQLPGHLCNATKAPGGPRSWGLGEMGVGQGRGILGTFSMQGREGQGRGL